MKTRYTFEAKEVAQLLLDQRIGSGKLRPGAYRSELETHIAGHQLVSIAMAFDDPPTPLPEGAAP